MVEHLSEDDARIVFSLLTDRFGFSSTLSPSTKSQTQLKSSHAQEKGIKLSEFLLDFWDYENSEFIKRYLAKGKQISRKHADNMKSLAKNYWFPYFGEDKFVQDLDEEELEDFFFYLFSERGLKGGTVNKAINCGSRAMRYLFEKRKISVNHDYD